MKKNLHYGKLAEATAAKMNAQLPGTLIAGRFRATDISSTSLAHMRAFSADVTPTKVHRCFACDREPIECPEDKRVECVCGRTYFKYYDVTDYNTFAEPSRWNLFWIRLNFKMSCILRKQPSS